MAENQEHEQRRDRSAHDDLLGREPPRGDRQCHRHRHASGDPAVVEYAQEVRRQRHRQRLAFADVEVAHGVGGEVGEDGDIAAGRGLERGAAESAEEIEEYHRHGNGVGGPRLDAADAHLLGPQTEPDALALGALAERIARQCQRASLRPTRSRDHGIEDVHRTDEMGNEGGGRPGVDLGGAAHLLDAAAVHHHDAVGHGERLLLVVRDHDGGDAEPALQRLDLVAQAHAHARIQRGQRLVEQQQRRRGGERPGERHALLLATRELGGVFGALLRHAHEGEQLGHALGDLGAGLTAVDEAVAHVLRRGQVGEQGVGLEDDAEVALRGGEARDIAAADLDVAGVLRTRGRR